jgi:hypothetical protein
MNGRPAFRKASRKKADRRILGKMEIPTNDDKGVLIAAELLQKLGSAHLVSSANRVSTFCLPDYGYESLLGSTCGGSTGRPNARRSSRSWLTDWNRIARIPAARACSRFASRSSTNRTSEAGTPSTFREYS